MNFKTKAFCLFAATILVSCSDKSEKVAQLFTLLPQEETGVDFSNVITETDSMNIIDYEYIYNGGGVALADFNNDGLEEIVFTGNMVPARIYKNLGNLKFEDITESSLLNTNGFWCTGINIADVNQDGLKDIYITTSTYQEPDRRKNFLFINESNGDEIKFSEQADEYAVADTSYTTNSVFFDYDNDGDLDLFLINNKMDKNDFSRYKRDNDDPSSPKIDKLLACEWMEGASHPVYKDVSEQAGITKQGYSLGVNIVDLNKDGWKDIYITNDFLSNDVLYINNGDGTFTDQIKEYFNHTAYSAMGNDVADLNNDGLQDIVAVDMLPETNYRKKTMMAANNYTNYINNSSFQYTFQFVRNVLQLNNGTSPKSGHPRFSDIAMMAGIEATDWSWTPMIADFDADGFRDLIITNGFPKDITDKDFMDYQSQYAAFIDKKEILGKIPVVKLKNYAYRNNGNLGFEDVGEAWGITTPSFSNGAAYGDLDNDGDLDYVVNNIDDAAHIYRNNSAKGDNNHYLQIELIGKKPNLDAKGTIINYKSEHISSSLDFNTSRGYLSCVSPKIYIGLGTDSLVDLEVIWPDHTVTTFSDVKANHVLTIDQTKSTVSPYVFQKLDVEPLLVNSPKIPGDTIRQQDNIDFNSDPLLFKKMSNHGPGIAVADVNGDGLDDYYVGGPRDFNGRLYIQTASGFSMTIMSGIDPAKEELAPVFTDVDNDGDPDLYIGCGSNEYNANDPKLQDELWINEGGKFTRKAELNVPNMQTSCVRAADYDGDGDIDFFIGGRSITYKFPQPETSFILSNESSGGSIKFTLIEAPFKDHKMMVADALWTDFDNDGKIDLMLAGDFGGIHLYKNTGKTLEFVANNTLNELTGWWNSINGADLDNDGDVDYVLGNFGLNSLVKVTDDKPVKIYSKDFDGNGSYDFIPTVFLKGENGKYQEAPYHVKGDLVKELNGFKKQFIYYSSIARAPIDSIISDDFRKGAYIVEAKNLNSLVLINEGNGAFKVVNLPKMAQVAPVMGTCIDDFDGDGQQDILVVGNDYGAEMTMGRLDASYGTMLKGDGKGGFIPVSMNDSGLDLKCEPRSIAKLYQGERLVYMITNYNGPVQGMVGSTLKSNVKTTYSDKLVRFLDASGKLLAVRECYQGNGYLSQSSLHLPVPMGCSKVEIVKYNGEKRTEEVAPISI
ncbi:MAG: VCBS repeat-containing protein [Saprospiraceae bacterium]|nr:VCBS repeat-containing protein [Saprospiraceae bacterium]